MPLDFSQFVTPSPSPRYQSRGAMQQLLAQLLADERAKAAQQIDRDQLAASQDQNRAANALRDRELGLRGQELGRDQSRLSLDQARFGFEQQKYGADQAQDALLRQQKQLDEFAKLAHDSSTYGEDAAQKLRAAGYQVEYPEGTFARGKGGGAPNAPAGSKTPGAAGSESTSLPPPEPRERLTLDSPTSLRTPGGYQLPTAQASRAPVGIDSSLPGMGGSLGGLGDLPPPKPTAPPAPGAPPGPPSSGTGGAPQSNMITVRDQTGKVVYQRDLTELRGDQGKAVAQAFAPLISQAGDPVEKRAAEMGMEHALGLVGTVPLEEAIGSGLKRYDFTVGEEGKTKRVGGKGTGGAPGALPNKYEHQLDEKDATWATKERDALVTQADIKALNEGERALANLEASVAQGTGIGDVNAVKQLIKATEDRISDADMRIALGSGGLWEQLKAKFGYVANSGKLGDDFMAEVRDLARAGRATISGRRNGLGEQVYQSIQNHPYPFRDRDRAAAWARGSVTGRYEAPPAQPGGKREPSGAPAPAAKPAAAPPAAAKPNLKQKLGY